MSFTYFNTMCFYNRFNLFNLCVQPCLFHTMFKAWLICFYMSSIHTQPASSYWFNPSRTAPVSLPPQVLFPRRPGWAMSTRTFNALVEPPGGRGPTRFTTTFDAADYCPPLRVFMKRFVFVMFVFFWKKCTCALQRFTNARSGHRIAH